ncbi:MAG: peptidase U32 family protein [Candidatus Sedimenticola sp. (ex Thyasira tokunagai)]
MKRDIELLAPGGDIDSIKAAILAGANAVYCGLDKFNARGRAKNITFENLPGILRLAHQNNCELFLTVNIIIVESELPALIKLLNKLVNTKLDGIIIQDLGLFYILNKYYPTLKIHASTQLTTHNEGQIKFLNRLNATRVNLSRELNLDEIRDLTATAHQHDLLVEVFVHGSNCVSFSGLCYMSSVHGGNSGNRGRCSQPCRDQYLTTSEGRDFPLNIKDNSAYSDLRGIADAKVDSIKIEGRIKKYHYVYTVVDTWRNQLNRFYEHDQISGDNSALRKVFNRDLSNSFLKGEVSRDTFIDNPRDNSAIHRAEKIGGATIYNLTTAKRELYDIKTEIIDDVKERIDQLSIEKVPLSIYISGAYGSPMKVTIKTSDSTFELLSETLIERATVTNSDEIQDSKSKKSRSQELTAELFRSRFKAINETEYFIDNVDLTDLQSDLFIPFKELTLIKNRILFELNGSIESVPPINLPRLGGQNEVEITPYLSALISSQDDLDLYEDSSAEIMFELPNCFNNGGNEFIDIFNSNSRLVPCFPSILIGREYQTALRILTQINPKYIVSNNSGIGYEAYRLGIPWVAGPYINIVNSFSLLSLKEYFGCTGSFISNELNKNQIKRIKKPDNFRLFYSIYHPIVLMTSKACFFHQVTGCEKNIVDNACIQRCEKSSFITNLKEASFFINKQKGYYHNIHNENNFLNTDITHDIPNMFDSLFLDLRDVKSNTKVTVDKQAIIKMFESHLNNELDSSKTIHQHIFPTTDTQYIKGI